MKTPVCLTILLLLINLGAFTQTATPPSTGDGSVSNPYQIENLNHLYWIAAHYTRWNFHYIQTNNIDATSTSGWFGGAGWTPIGNWPYQFEGTYNGQGHSINGISCNRPADYAGLFGMVSYASISNLELTNLNIIGHPAGGLAGQVASTPITNCSTTGSVSGDNIVGGLVGGLYVSTTGDAFSVTECYSSVNVTCTGDGSGYGYAGGFIGSIDNYGGNYLDVVVSECGSTGDVQGFQEFGGFVGVCQTAKIQNCTSTGNVQGTNTAGGFIGRADASTMIINCYSRGNVTRVSSAPVSNRFFGGFMGFIQESHVSNCYSTGSVTYAAGTGPTGKGFLGGLYNIIMMVANFYDMETSGQTGSGGSYYTGKTTAQMKTLSTFTNEAWDFIGETTNGTNDYWSIDGVNNDGYPFLSWENSCWTGSARSSDWFAGSNWSSGAVPTSSDIVSIAYASTNPSIGGSTTAVCAGLIVASGCSVTIQNDGKLTTSGDVYNEGTILIESDATGTGSFITTANINGSGTFNMQRYMANDNGWHLLSSPANGVTIVGSDFVPSESAGVLPVNFDFYSYKETENSLPWVNIRASDASVNPAFETTFTNAKGYLVAYNTDYGTTTFNYGLTYNTGTIGAQALTYTSVNSFAGWNLIGNPYPSGIDWNLASRTAFEDNFAYIYNENKSGGAGYEAVDGAQPNAYIAPNQGFFVKVSVSGTFDFTNAIRVHSGIFLKEYRAVDKLVLRLERSGKYDETTIRLNDQSAASRDRTDALKLYSLDSEIPQLFSFSEDGKALSINSIAAFNMPESIPLGIYIPQEGQYTISIPEALGQMEGKHPMLEDKISDTWHDFDKAGNYIFTSAAASDMGRFVLHFTGAGIDSPTETEDVVKVWKTANCLNISNPEHLNGNITVVNLMGQNVGQYILTEALSQKIFMYTDAGIYIVVINYGTGVQCTKVYWK